MTAWSEREHLAELAKGGVACEVGSWHGGSLLHMARDAKRVHSIDWHRGMDEKAADGDTLPTLWQNVLGSGLADKVVLHVGRVEDVAPVLCATIFDLLFIDGTHTYDAVRRDFELLEPTVKPGGKVAFHDYGTFDGITRFVDEFKHYLVGSLAVVEL